MEIKPIIAKPTVKNVTMTLANTEYSYTLPAGTQMYRVKLRGVGASLKLAVGSGGTNRTIANGQTFERFEKSGGSSLYFQSPTAGQVAEILSFQ